MLVKLVKLQGLLRVPTCVFLRHWWITGSSVVDQCDTILHWYQQLNRYLLLMKGIKYVVTAWSTHIQTCPRRRTEDVICSDLPKVAPHHLNMQCNCHQRSREPNIHPTVYSADILDISFDTCKCYRPMPPRIDTRSRDTIAARAAKTMCALDSTSRDGTVTKQTLCHTTTLTLFSQTRR